MLFARSVVLLMGLLASACAGFCLPRSSYQGDGDFKDSCVVGSWSIFGRDRYSLDLGVVDLTGTGEWEFSIGGLPRARMWLLGVYVDPGSDLPPAARLDSAVIEMEMRNAAGELVIAQSDAIKDWAWSLGGDNIEGVGPSFVFAAGRTRDIPAAAGDVHPEAIDVLADGGWGTYFKPDRQSRYMLRLRVLEPDSDARFFNVRLEAHGSNYGGSL
jgi:hypothetical protein